MMRKARLAIRKVNVALDSPGYCFGAGRSLKLVCFPALTHVLPLISTCRFAHLCRSRPRGSILAPTLVTLPSMSLVPFAPFPICGNTKPATRHGEQAPGKLTENQARARLSPRDPRIANQMIVKCMHRNRLMIGQ